MAQVTLEHVYKQFPQRQQQKANATPVAAGSAVLSPGGEAPPHRDEGALDNALRDAPNAVSVLRDINLAVQDGEFLALVGPSGCGKSTLLRLIAGLETLTAGDIWVGDRKVNDLPPKQRNVAMVFQSYALYPHMSVYDNLAFGLRRMGDDRLSSISPQQQVAERLTRALPRSWRYKSPHEADIQQRVRQVAQMLQIDPLL
ncbi:MAG: ATP-binding cassette domain-containing protein, partial [Cyanobacteria bacterium P01_A01_bin.135]